MDWETNLATILKYTEENLAQQFRDFDIHDSNDEDLLLSGSNQPRYVINDENNVNIGATYIRDTIGYVNTRPTTQMQTESAFNTMQMGPQLNDINLKEHKNDKSTSKQQRSSSDENDSEWKQYVHLKVPRRKEMKSRGSKELPQRIPSTSSPTIPCQMYTSPTYDMVQMMEQVRLSLKLEVDARAAMAERQLSALVQLCKSTTEELDRLRLEVNANDRSIYTIDQVQTKMRQELTTQKDISFHLQSMCGKDEAWRMQAENQLLELRQMIVSIRDQNISLHNSLQDKLSRAEIGVHVNAAIEPMKAQLQANVHHHSQQILEITRANTSSSLLIDALTQKINQVHGNEIVALQNELTALKSLLHKRDSIVSSVSSRGNSEEYLIEKIIKRVLNEEADMREKNCQDKVMELIQSMKTEVIGIMRTEIDKSFEIKKHQLESIAPIHLQSNQCAVAPQIELQKVIEQYYNEVENKIDSHVKDIRAEFHTQSIKSESDGVNRLNTTTTEITKNLMSTIDIRINECMNKILSCTKMVEIEEKTRKVATDSMEDEIRKFRHSIEDQFHLVRQNAREANKTNVELVNKYTKDVESKIDTINFSLKEIRGTYDSIELAMGKKLSEVENKFMNKINEYSLEKCPKHASTDDTGINSTRVLAAIETALQRLQYQLQIQQEITPALLNLSLLHNTTQGAQALAHLDATSTQKFNRVLPQFSASMTDGKNMGVETSLFYKADVGTVPVNCQNSQTSIAISLPNKELSQSLDKMACSLTAMPLPLDSNHVPTSSSDKNTLIQPIVHTDKDEKCLSKLKLFIKEESKIDEIPRNNQMPSVNKDAILNSLASSTQFLHHSIAEKASQSILNVQLEPSVKSASITHLINTNPEDPNIDKTVLHLPISILNHQSDNAIVTSDKDQGVQNMIIPPISPPPPPPPPPSGHPPNYFGAVGGLQANQKAAKPAMPLEISANPSCLHGQVSENFSGARRKSESRSMSPPSHLLCANCRLPVRADQKSEHDILLCSKRMAVCESCQEKVSWDKLEDHKNFECKMKVHTTLSSPTSKNTEQEKKKCRHCALEFTWQELIDHEPLCDQMLKQCPHCLRKHTISELPTHIEHCDCRLVNCPNSCGGKFLQRGIAKHIATRCPNKPITTNANEANQSPIMSTELNISPQSNHQATSTVVSPHRRSQNELYPSDSGKECKFCDESFSTAQLSEHEKNCEWKPRRCQYCNMVIISRDLQRHEISCSNNSKACPYCGENMPQSALPTHTGRCSKRPIKCIRCYQQFPADLILSHSKSCAYFPERSQVSSTEDNNGEARASSPSSRHVISSRRNTYSGTAPILDCEVQGLTISTGGAPSTRGDGERATITRSASINLVTSHIGRTAYAGSIPVVSSTFKDNTFSKNQSDKIIRENLGGVSTIYRDQAEHEADDGDYLTLAKIVATWSVDNVCRWLREDVSLPTLVPHFAKHQCNGLKLLNLTEDVLINELGILNKAYLDRILTAVKAIKVADEISDEEDSEEMGEEGEGEDDADDSGDNIHKS